MVSRESDRDDCRHNLVSLTDLGRESMAGLIMAAQMVLGEAVRQVAPQDVAVCKHVLHAVCSALDSQKALEEGGGT